MVLSHPELVQLVRDGVIGNGRVTEEMINGSSIDVTLAHKVLIEKQPMGAHQRVVSPDKPQQFREKNIIHTDHNMWPGEFLLAATVQSFKLPLDISMEFYLRSTMARLGLEHLNACWCDPGWESECLTLEFKNMNLYHQIKLQAGMRIGQVVFHRHTGVPETVSYRVRGKYNSMTGATPAKPEIR